MSGIHTHITSTPDTEFDPSMLQNLGPVSDTPPNQEDILSLSEEGGNVVYINASNDPTETFRKHTKTLLDKILSVFTTIPEGQEKEYLSRKMGVGDISLPMDTNK